MARPSFMSELGAMYRQGASDFINALQAFPDSQRGVDMMGTPLSPTPQMVSMSQSDRVKDILDHRAASRQADAIEAKEIRANSITGEPEKVNRFQDDLQKGFSKVTPKDEPVKSDAAAEYNAERNAAAERGQEPD